ncbi:MAG: hypothetical protein LBI69_01440 [Puniceicoccales bacterium]|nr:hypothetical protein [Puniceicoccales bacterium]
MDRGCLRSGGIGLGVLLCKICFTACGGDRADSDTVLDIDDSSNDLSVTENQIPQMEQLQNENNINAKMQNENNIDTQPQNEHTTTVYDQQIEKLRQHAGKESLELNGLYIQVNKIWNYFASVRSATREKEDIESLWKL